jgi:hypothetical protein
MATLAELIQEGLDWGYDCVPEEEVEGMGERADCLVVTRAADGAEEFWQHASKLHELTPGSKFYVEQRHWVTGGCYTVWLWRAQPQPDLLV